MAIAQNDPVAQHAKEQADRFPDASAKGEAFEVRNVRQSDDDEPNPSKSLPLSPARQALIDDIIALYSCEPTVERVKRYTPDCLYDDQFVYASNRYKMAGQWFALPKFFKDSSNHGYEVIVNEPLLIQFKNKQSWTFKGVPKTAMINALVSLSLDPATVDTDFIRVKYHKDQADRHDYSHEGFGFHFKKYQADHVSEVMDDPRVKEFIDDQGPELEGEIRKYGSGDSEEVKKTVKTT